MSLHKEWATFIDPRDGWKWEIDLTFLASAWKCIYGCGCKGIHGVPVGGCCQDGVVDFLVCRGEGALRVLVSTQASVTGLYLPPVLKTLLASNPPQTIISLPVQTAV